MRATGADSGLITLEWLLIVGAIAGLAASSVLVVQRVVDDHSEVPDDPLVRVLEADIAAAFIADEANEAVLSGDPPAQVDTVFGARCTALESEFADVVEVGGASWRAPVLGPPSPPSPPALDTAARCAVTPRSDLGT